MIATVSETTRKSASTIGESYKTLAARYMNVKVGKFIDDETGENINDTEAVLGKLGIQLRNSQNEWRDMWDVMNEVGQKWGTYTDMEKNAIVVAQAGVRQAENMRATYNNWNKVLEYTAAAYDSAGYAADKYSVYLDSIEGRTNKMIATYQDMVSDPVFSDLIKDIIGAVTWFGELIDKIGLTNIAFLCIFNSCWIAHKNLIPRMIQGVGYLVTNFSMLPKLVSTAMYAIGTGMTDVVLELKLLWLHSWLLRGQ